MRDMPAQMTKNKERRARDYELGTGVLTKNSLESRDTPHNDARAEHREYADDRTAFPKHRQETALDSEDSSSRYAEGPELLEGWSAPALERDQMSSFTGQPSIRGRNESIRMMLLCAIHFGITFTWYGFPVIILSVLHAPRYLMGHQRLLLFGCGLLETKRCSLGRYSCRGTMAAAAGSLFIWDSPSPFASLRMF